MRESCYLCRAMKIYKFRVLVDHEVDAFRDIELRDNQTFEDLHHAIIKAFDFFGDQMSSFYVSNAEWERGEEIVLMDMGFEGPMAPPVMRTTTLGSRANSEQTKFLYVYDFLRMWIFYIELIEVNDAADTDEEFPRVVLTFGNAPAESSKELADDLALLDPFLFDDPSLNPAPAKTEKSDESLDDEIGNMFDSLEDYDGF